jgi:Skp family chaperone for outer membrane proteins
MMKKLLISCSLLLVFAVSLAAQSVGTPLIYESGEKMVERYNLNDEQQSALDIIINRRQENLEAIHPLLSTDEAVYWNKRKAIYLGQQNSIERILTTNEQRTAFSEVKKNDRIAESVIIKRLLAAGQKREVARFLLLTERY